MSTRVGPVSLVEGHGLAFGNPNGMHVLITREELLWRESNHVHDALDWDEVAIIDWVVPSSRVGFVRLADAFVQKVSPALDAVGIRRAEPQLARVRVTSVAGDEIEWTATPHHAAGYPAADLRVVVPFLGQLRGSPVMRARLGTDPRATLAELQRQRG